MIPLNCWDDILSGLSLKSMMKFQFLNSHFMALFRNVHLLLHDVEIYVNEILDNDKLIEMTINEIDFSGDKQQSLSFL